MNLYRKSLLIILISGLAAAGYAILGSSTVLQAFPFAQDEPEAATVDTLSTASPAASPYGVKKMEVVTYDDLNEHHPVDLPDPGNVVTSVEYDVESGNYVLHTKVGDMDVTTPFVLTPEEYQRYSLQKQMSQYWRDKNAETQSNYEDKFNITDMKFSLGPADKVFGPGGVQIKTQGSAELSFGVVTNRVDNPSLSQRLRRTTTFDFDENIQLNVNAKVGDKINFTMNYNTEATFDFDQQNLKLAYEGHEDEIIRKVEAGNITMPLNTALIRGSSSLFGIKTELQFGRLNVVAVASQQKASSQSVNSRGGAQLLDFEVRADNYDENRHFFLSHYFRETYDKNMSQLPYITSGVTINRIEVWITNKRGNYEQSRNIISFMDLAENTRIDNEHWATYGAKYPYNGANSLYNEVKSVEGIRDIQLFNQLMDANFSGYNIVGGEDYEKVESARRLDASEYTLNSQLGYISLKTALNSDEVLAVAFEYTVGGQVYQVGEFSTDGVDAPNSLIVKLLRGTSTTPLTAMWDLMMKNIYYLGGTNVQQDKFKLEVQYLSDSTGVYLNYLTEGDIKNMLLNRVMGLDRLDSYNEARPDGQFDFVEGYTIYAQSGRMIFPVVEPFGEHLRKMIGNDAIADKYVYQELYDSSKVVAQEQTNSNKYILKGKYQATSGSTIQLNAMNVPRGSVKVTAGGAILTENVDFTVDYSMGTVLILNEAILASGTNIEVELENQSTYNLQRKTLVGTHLEYAFNKDFSVGGTIMHLSEMPLVTKTMIGSEPISNTIWGLNMAYRNENQWLTKAVDAIPLIHATVPSTIAFQGEFAQLIPGHKTVDNNPGYAYLDDFESTVTGIDLKYPYYWKLASTPYDPAADALFPEAGLSNNVDYGKNRALMAWFTIDNSVFNRSNSTTPPNIRGNKDLLSNHLTREVTEQEIFPNRQAVMGQSTILSVLNLSYYPQERGPYNVDLDINGTTGLLNNPQKRFGGMMRKIETSDFESANIEYIEFWMMDPFVNDTNATHKGGDLYFNIGDISEDILKDGKKFFENGLPANGDTTLTTSTVWGRIPTAQSTVMAFDNDVTARRNQDVGLNGLRNEDEFTFPTYRDYLEGLRTILSSTVISEMENNQFSPFNDPAGDKYHYYRGSDYDEEGLGILQRYKYYNGTEGNSPDSNDNGETYTTSATTVPDVEDINQDNTLNEYERYYQYKVSLRRADMQVGSNYITDKVERVVTLENGVESSVAWYQFKIPIREYQKRVGSIRDFKSIRFMRIFMTDFEQETFLRFATMELVRGDWRRYTKDLYPIATPPTSNGSIDVSAVNIEENDNKEPVNYVLPPGVTRETDPSQPQIRQENEQSMSLRVYDLAPEDSRAVYKNITYDMRMYRRLQMFTHAEALIDNTTNLKDYETTVFIRMGSDFTQNYYEYEIPLKLTPQGHYSSADASEVWPEENMFNFPLELFTNLKLNRNRVAGQSSSASLSKIYSEYDPDNLKNKVSIMGNPNLGEVQSIMIGVRNRGRDMKSVEVWVDELRLTDYDEDGGWGATGNLAVGFSDFGSVNVSGQMETAGFGSIDQTLQNRRLDDYYQFNISTQFELGRFFPEKGNVRLPLYYAYSIENSLPKYNPLDQDILLDDALDALTTQAEKDSLRNLSQTRTINESFNLTNMKVDIRSKKPMPWDPGNFSFSFAYNKLQELDPEIDRNFTKDWRGSIAYNYSTTPKPWEPFKNSKALKNPAFKIIKDFNVNYLPSLLAFNVNIHRQYTETQLRDLDGNMNLDIYDPYNSLLSFSKDFVWNREFELRYDFSKALKFSFRSATNSRIEETYLTPVNREFFPDEYESWKDTVMMSLREFGKPLAYQQVFTASWDLPINKIPYLEFINAKAQYSSTYSWDVNVSYNNDVNMGNTISNLTMWQADGNLNFETLYNKSKYLKRVNQQYSSRKTTPKKPNKFTPRTFTKTVNLKKGENVKLTHRLNSEKVKVQFADVDGKELQIKYVSLDKNNIELRGKDSLDNVAVTITSVDPNFRTPSEKMMDMSARFLMMFRRVSFSYKQTNSLTMTGFMPDAIFMGQETFQGAMAPGLDFAFGVPKQSFINDAIDRGWIVLNDSIINPAAFNYSTDLDFKVNIEPIPGLKIDINAKRVTTEQNSIQYMYDGMPQTFTGTYRMTHVAIASAFEKRGNLSNNYHSDVFEQFLSNREVMMQRLQAKYSGTKYPTTGFMADNALSGTTYNSENGSFGLNSFDVLIPSFLAAYTGQSIDKIGTSAFPSLASLLPNWKISYDGLTRIPWIEKYFKSVTLNHAYQCTYNVGSYSSFSTYTQNEDGLGFVRDVTNGNPIPSSPYDIASVALTENFGPFLSLDVALKNSFTGKIEYRKQRNMTLNLTSNQLLEATSDEWVVGVGYVLKDFDVILKLKENKQKKVKNDLTTRIDFSFKDITTLLRKIDTEDVQPTNGNTMLTIKFTADYVFSSKLNLRFFYDYQANNPLISTSYPMSNQNVGFSIKFMLTR